jgi:hypothetical protein
MRDLSRNEVQAMLLCPDCRPLKPNPFKKLRVRLFELGSGEHLLVLADGKGIVYDPSSETVEFIDVPGGE